MPSDLRRSAQVVRLLPGDTVFTQGTRPQSVDYVQAGEVHLLRCTPGGGDILLHRIQNGFIAEASIDAASYHCDAIAVKVTTLRRFERQRFRAALDRSLDFHSAWSTMFARGIRRLRTQCERLALNRARDRIAHYMAREGQDGVLELRAITRPTLNPLRGFIPGSELARNTQPEPGYRVLCDALRLQLSAQPPPRT